MTTSNELLNISYVEYIHYLGSRNFSRVQYTTSRSLRADSLWAHNGRYAITCLRTGEPQDSDVTEAGALRHVAQ